MAGRRSMDDTPTFGQKTRWDNFVTRWEWDEKGGYRSARFFGDVCTDFVHNVQTKTGKFYPEFCHGWDVDNCKFFENRKELCPCCALEIKGSYRYFMNVIDLEAEENKPSRPKVDWSPIRFIDMSTTLFARVKELKTVNKNISIADTLHGANVQIKYNENLDPGSQYAATLDTKDVAITEEQKTYIVTQKYPEGAAKIIRGENGLPAQFEYVRCVNSRDEMVKSLRRNGYYGESEEASAAAHSFDERKTLTREETVAQIEAEAPIETVDLDISNIFPGTPSASDEGTEETVKEQKVKEPYDECPTEYGKFASHMDCFSKCEVAMECKKETDSKVTSKAETKKKQQPIVEAVDDDDDTV